MKLTRSNLLNLIFIAALALIFLTPIGFHVRVFVSGIFSFSPSEVDKEERSHLSDYNWQLVDSNSNRINFSEVENKVVVLNFWATWCPPCVAEMPSLQALYNDYKNQVSFVFVAHDKPEAVQEFIEKNDFDLPVYFEASAPPNEVVTDRIPTTYIMNSDGTIVVQKTGAADWNSEKTRSILDKLIEK